MPLDRTQDGPRVSSRGAKLLAAGMAAAAAIAVAACFVNRPAAVEPSGEETKPKERLFRDWPKPDLIVMISGEQHGYLDPCGCSRPQIGGRDIENPVLAEQPERLRRIDAVGGEHRARLIGERKLHRVVGIGQVFDALGDAVRHDMQRCRDRCVESA